MADLLLLFLVLAAGLVMFLLFVETHGIVLAFHSVSLKERDPFTIRPRKVVGYIRILEWLGYTSASVEELHGDRSKARRRYTVTFDDAYRDNFHFICWLLRKGIQVIIFVPTAHLGQKNSWDEGDKQIMTLEQLQYLGRCGTLIGSHGHRHRRMGELSTELLREDLDQSRQQICKIKGGSAHILAYPYGAYDDRVLAVMREKDISFGFTTIPRQINSSLAGSSQLQLGRLSMRHEWNMADFLFQVFLMRLRGWKQRLCRGLKQ